MPIDIRERWKKLCEEAETENDSETLVELDRPDLLVQKE
jgi:hypothetical protein